MLNITINLEAGIARLATASPIKAGGAVPVRLVFDTNPGAVLEAASLALSAQSSTPAVLAYLDVFEKQSALLYTGSLNSNDVRLLAHLAGKQAQTLDCELSLDFAGSDRQVLPNFAVTVQQPIVTGPEASEGGPVWVTESPEDGKIYGRKDGGWVEVVGGGGEWDGTLIAPDASQWVLSVDNDGVLTATKV